MSASHVTAMVTPLPVAATRHAYLWLLLVSAIAILACLPFVHIVFSVGDEGVLLHGADRMLAGRSIYNDFFEFLPPGGFLITEAWFGMTGVSFVSERLLALLTIVGIGCFAFLACRRASGNALLSVALTSGWLFTSQAHLPTEISHHWYTTLLSTFVVWASILQTEELHRREWRSLITGVAAGAAVMVTPSCGLLAAAAGLTPFVNIRQHRLALVAYIVGGAVAPLCSLAYIASHHALAAAFDDVIVFTATQYSGIQGVPLGHDARLADFPVLLLLAVLPFLTLLMIARDWREYLRDPLLHVCSAFALAGFAGSFPRADIVHIGYGVPLVLPLFAYCVTRLARGWHAGVIYVLAAAGAVLWIPAGLQFQWQIAHATTFDAIVSTPRGNAAFRGNPGLPEVLAQIAATPGGDKVFFYPSMPMAPFLTAREHVARFDILTPGYTTPSQFRDACLSAMRSASWVVIDRYNLNPKVLKSTFPAMKNPEPPETKSIERALETGFDLVAQKGVYELRHRSTVADETLCDQMKVD